MDLNKMTGGAYSNVKAMGQAAAKGAAMGAAGKAVGAMKKKVVGAFVDRKKEAMKVTPGVSKFERQALKEGPKSK